MSDLNKEYKNFLEDLDKNIKDKQDLNYVKERFQIFLDIMMEQMDNTIKFKEEKIEEIERKQEDLENKLNRMQDIVNHIEEDIYSEEGFDFEIACPYCNYEFVIDIDENKTEIECPECNNIIELDWSGNLEDDFESNCHGRCSSCGGCERQEDQEDENDDDM